MCCSNTPMCRARWEVIWDASGLAVLAHVHQCDCLASRQTTHTADCVECLSSQYSSPPPPPSSSSSSCHSGNLRTSTSSANSRPLRCVSCCAYSHLITTTRTATHGMLGLTVQWDDWLETVYSSTAHGSWPIYRSTMCSHLFHFTRSRSRSFSTPVK